MKRKKKVLKADKNLFVPIDFTALFTDEGDGKDDFFVEFNAIEREGKPLMVYFKDIKEMEDISTYLVGLAKELKKHKEMTTIEKMTYLNSMTFKVEYDGYSHLTTYNGAFSLLDGRLKNKGVIRDAKAAALRAFEDKCLYSDWNFPYEAGVITIAKVEDDKKL